MSSHPSRHSVTELLSLVESGAQPVESLLEVVYAELRAIADVQMARERRDHTLQPTALVHEAFLRLVDSDTDLGNSKGQFLSIAARAMRNLLVDHARALQTEKRGGASRTPVTVSGFVEEQGGAVEILDLHSALEQLEELDERQARIVEMTYFAGMSGDEVADELRVHRNTVVRELRMARAWLRRELDRAHGGAADD